MTETTKLKHGTRIQLNSAIGLVNRVVVKHDQNHVNVCTEEEFKAAQVQQRKTVAICFPCHDIVQIYS